MAKHGAAHRLYGLIRAFGQRIQAARLLEKLRCIHGLRHTRLPSAANNTLMILGIQEKSHRLLLAIEAINDLAVIRVVGHAVPPYHV